MFGAVRPPAAPAQCPAKATDELLDTPLAKKPRKQRTPGGSGKDLASAMEKAMSLFTD